MNEGAYICKITFTYAYSQPYLLSIFSEGRQIKFFFRNTSTGNRLNHCIIVHVHCGKTDQSNMEVAKDFKGFRFPL